MDPKTVAMKPAKLFLDILYPRQCIGCGVSSPETFRYICWECWSDTSRVEPPFCAHCGDPVAGAVDHSFTCYSCSAVPPAFDAARSASRYDGVVGEALRQLKYERAIWLAPDMAELLLRIWRRVYTNEHHGTLHDALKSRRRPRVLAGS